MGLKKKTWELKHPYLMKLWHASKVIEHMTIINNINFQNKHLHPKKPWPVSRDYTTYVHHDSEGQMASIEWWNGYPYICLI